MLGADFLAESSRSEDMRWRSSFSCVRDLEGAFGAADSNGEARAPGAFVLRAGGGEVECEDEVSSCACVRLAAERARRAASRLDVGGEEVVGERGFLPLCCSRWRAARVDCKCVMELEFALPEPEEPAGWRKREMPSEGREGSLRFGGEALPFAVWWKAGEAFEPVGVTVAETDER